MDKHEILKSENQTLAVEKMASNYFKRRFFNSGKGNHDTLLNSEIMFYKSGWNLTDSDSDYLLKEVKYKFHELKRKYWEIVKESN